MIEGRWSSLGHVVSPGLGYSRGHPRPSFLLGGRVYFWDYQWVNRVESGVQVRPQPNTFIIYKGVVAYAISQLRFDMITLKLESHAVSHARRSAFVLVKKRNLESLTNKVECTSAAMDFHYITRVGCTSKPHAGL